MTIYFDQPSYLYEYFEESSADFYCDPYANCENFDAAASYVETRSGTLFVPSQQHQADYPSPSFESDYEFVPDQQGFDHHQSSIPSCSISPSSSRPASHSIDVPEENFEDYGPLSSYVETLSGTLFVPTQQYSFHDGIPPTSFATEYEFVPNEQEFSQSSISSCSISPSSSRSASPSIGVPETILEDYVEALEHEHYRHIDFDSMIQNNGGPQYLKRKHFQPTMEDLLRSNVKPYYQNDAAILKLNDLRNSFLDCDILDLHYLQCNLAWKVLRTRFEEIIDGQRPKVLFVVPGKGKGSRDGVSKLKNVVADFARNEGVRCVEMPGNEGVFILTFM